jgi:hypothetical protein
MAHSGFLLQRASEAIASKNRSHPRTKDSRSSANALYRIQFITGAKNKQLHRGERPSYVADTITLAKVEWS